MGFFQKQKGFASIIIALGMMLVVLAIPLTVKLVEQSQEIRSKAMFDEDGGGGSLPENPAPPPEQPSQPGSDLPSGYHPESQPVQEAPQPRDDSAAQNAQRQAADNAAQQAADQAAQQTAQQASQQAAAQNAQRQVADNAAQQVADQAAAQARADAAAAKVAREEEQIRQQQEAQTVADQAAQQAAQQAATQNAQRQATDNAAQQAADQAAQQATQQAATQNAQRQAADNATQQAADQTAQQAAQQASQQAAAQNAQRQAADSASQQAADLTVQQAQQQQAAQATPTPKQASCTCPSGSSCPDDLYSHCPSGITPAPTPTPAPTSVPTPTTTPPVPRYLPPSRQKLSDPSAWPGSGVLPFTAQPVSDSEYAQKYQVYVNAQNWCDNNPDACRQHADEINKNLAIIGIATPIVVLSAPIWGSIAIGAGGALATGGPAGAVVYGSALIEGAPAAVQTGVGIITLGSIAYACQTEGYSSNDCMMGITGMQVAQIAERAAYNTPKSISASVAETEQGTITRVYGVPRGTGQMPSSVEPYNFQKEAAKLAASGDYKGAMNCISGACRQAGYNSYLRPVVTYNGQQVSGISTTTNGGVSGNIEIAQSVNGVPRTPIQIIDTYQHEVGHAFDYKTGMTQIQSEARQYYSQSVFRATVGDTAASNKAYDIYVRFATGYYPK